MAKIEYKMTVEMSASPPAITVVPWPVTPTPVPTPVPVPVPSGAVYRVKGNKLFDPRGERVINRGVEQVLWQASWLNPEFVRQIGTDANAVRIVPYYLNRTPTGEEPCTIAQIEVAIRWAIGGNMLCSLAIDGGQNPDVWFRPEVMVLLKKYSPWLVLHAVGESGASSDDAWVTSSKATIARMRQAGLKMPLEIMARTSGRNLPTILAKGQQLVDADPEHNLIFGWQAYWGSDGAYQREYGMTLEQGMRKAAAATVVVQVGLLYHSDPQDNSPQTVPFVDLMRLAQELGLGWLWWDWRMGVDDLTTDGVFGHWTGWKNPAGQGAQAVTQTDPNSIANTAVTTQYQTDQKAP
jgi:mannan endo-1,4-beta-mannosidase